MRITTQLSELDPILDSNLVLELVQFTFCSPDCLPTVLVAPKLLFEGEGPISSLFGPLWVHPVVNDIGGVKSFHFKGRVQPNAL